MTGTDRLLTETVPTLLIGGAGAAIFLAVGFPAAVLTGPAAAVSFATLIGLRSHVPTRLRDAVFLVIGVSIGSTVTPDVIATALAWPISLVVLTVTLLLILVIVRSVLMRGFGYDRTTAMLAATPGHLSYVLGLSTDLKADIPSVALVQSVRVLLLTLLVPLLIAFLGGRGLIPSARSWGDFRPLRRPRFRIRLAAGAGFQETQGSSTAASWGDGSVCHRP